MKPAAKPGRSRPIHSPRAIVPMLLEEALLYLAGTFVAIAVPSTELTR
jgi:hypothetical protein